MKSQRTLLAAIKWVALTLLIAFTALEGWVLWMASIGHDLNEHGPEPASFYIEVLVLIVQAAAIIFSPWSRLPLVILGILEWLSMLLYAMIAQHQSLHYALGTSAFGAMFLLLSVVYAVAARALELMGKQGPRPS